MFECSRILAILILSLQIIPAQEGVLVWEDNFNLGYLDSAKWNIEIGTGVNGDWGTGQVDRARPENVTFQEEVPGAEDACLVISTKEEFYIDRNYTSGRINTADKASWGPGHRIMARILPHDVRYMGQGFAFWMMPDEVPDGWDYIMWPQGGEIDIMEYVGSIPFHNLGSVHYAWFWENNQWQSWNHGHQGAYYSYEDEQVPYPAEPGYGNYPPSMENPFAGSNAFHIYGIDWFEDRMEFFVDTTIYHVHYFNDGGGFEVDGEDEFSISDASGQRVASSEYSHHFTEWYPFEHDLYIILSAGVGGSAYTYGGPIVPEAEFPCSVYIDWVRVYELNDTNPAEIVHKPENFRLHQNCPNPFNPVTTIQYDLNTTAHVRLGIYDMRGRVIRQLLHQHNPAGSHSHAWDARDDAGNQVQTGVYFCVLQAEEQSDTIKLVYLR